MWTEPDNARDRQRVIACGGCFERWKLFSCGELCVSLQKVYSAKQRIPYMGLGAGSYFPLNGWIRPSASASCAWPCSSPLTQLTFGLQLPWTWLACLSLLATEPKLDIRGRRTGTELDSTRNPIDFDSVFVKRMKRHEIEMRNMKRLLGQYSDRQNKMQCK